jgi:hypothetical protein
MKKTTLILTLCAFATAAQAGPIGAEPTYTAPPPPPPMPELFGPGWMVSPYAAFLTPDADLEGDIWGGGVALEYYFTTYLGLGISAELADVDGDVGGVYALSGTARYPVGTYFAPYITAAFGLQNYVDTEIVGRAGVGLQVQFNERFGMFADWLYAFPGGGGGDDDFEDYQTIRMGLTFKF